MVSLPRVEKLTLIRPIVGSGSLGSGHLWKSGLSLPSLAPTNRQRNGRTIRGASSFSPAVSNGGRRRSIRGVLTRHRQEIGNSTMGLMPNLFTSRLWLETDPGRRMASEARVRM